MAPQSEEKTEREAGAGHVGALLQASRQRLGEELPDVALMLRIRLPYMAAIEAGRYRDLPGATYAVGFIRAYAEHLGLDSDEVVRRFKAETIDGGANQKLSFPTPVPETGIPGGAYVFIGLVIAVLAYGTWYISTTEDGFFAELISPLDEQFAGLLSGNNAETEPSAGADQEKAPPTVTTAEEMQTPEPKPLEQAGDVGSSASPANDTPSSSTTDQQPTPAEAPELEPAVADAEPEAPAPAPETVADNVMPQTAPETSDAPPATATAQPSAAPASSPVPTVAPKPVAAPAPKPVVPPVTPVTPVTPVPAAATAPTAVPEERASAPATPPVEKAVPVSPATPAPQSEPGTVSDVIASIPPAAENLAPPAPVEEFAAASPPVTAEPPEQAVPEAVTPAPPPIPAQAESETEAEAETEVATANQQAAGGIRIVINAKNNSWIQVRDDVANQMLVTRLLTAGDSYEVPDRPGLVLLTGNAGALEITVDGSPVPSIGGAGVVRRGVVLEADRLKAGTAVTN